MDVWIMIGIMVFVLIAQAGLWIWVILERRRKLPDVEVLNWRDLYNSARRAVDEYDKSMRYRRR